MDEGATYFIHVFFFIEIGRELVTVESEKEK